MNVDMNKTYRTRNGLEVKIYAVLPDHEWGVHGAVLEQGAWYLRGWKIDGTNASPGHPLDLVEVKPRIKGEYWLNIYTDDFGKYVYRNKEDADSNALPCRIACIRREYDVEEGEGL